MNIPPTDQECPSCGFPVDPERQDVCPKCEASIRVRSGLGLLEVDVVHGGETWEEAERKTVEAIDRALHWGHAGVKIVHGHGATTGRSVIGPRAVALMRRLADRTGGRFTKDRRTPGASLIWFNEG